MSWQRNLPSVAVSVVLHVIALLALAIFRIGLPDEVVSHFIESVAPDEERQIEEIQKELDTQQVSATTMNFVAGSVSTEAVGGSNAPLAQQKKIEFEEVVKLPDFTYKAAPQELTGLDVLGDDLGETEVTGDVGAVVEGYGAALDRMTQELIRLMRSQQLLVVWMFDESGSMKDDQQEIKTRLNRVYEELKVANDSVGPDKKTRSSGRPSDALLTMITSFGGEFHPLMQRPSSDVAELMAAIDRIPEDATGAEKTFEHIHNCIKAYLPMTTGANKRRLVLIVVSDESGDDGENVEAARDLARRSKCPIYVMGREAVFGSLYAHVRWVQPVTGHVHLLPIRRGPETPFAELLQFDGFHKRTDAQMSGFGPYEQVRLVRDTGGIFFQLPHEEQDLNDFQDYKFDMLDLKEYLPSLDSRLEYEKERNSSPFRKAVWDCIVVLNPYEKSNAEWLDVPTGGWFHREPGQSANEVNARLQKIMRVLQVLKSATVHLEKAGTLRDKEPSLRWRANYDLIHAQLYAYTVRLLEYYIGLDQYSKTIATRTFRNPKATHWSVVHGPGTVLMPDEHQQKVLNVSPEQLEKWLKTAQEQLQAVVAAHPKTPWARRAQWELNRKFGVSFAEHQHIPPKNPPPKTPRPTPPQPPKL